MNIIYAAKELFAKFFYPNNQLNERIVPNGVGSKRVNDENVSEDVSVKRRRLSPSSDTDVINIDLTESSSDAIFPDIMPRHRKTKDKRNGLDKNNHVETIEVFDDDVKKTDHVIDLESNDLEIVEEITPSKNVRSSAASSSVEDIEIVSDYQASKNKIIFNTPYVKSYLSLSNIQPVSSRNQRIKFENRTLRELNNRSSISNVHPSEIHKKSATPAFPISSSGSKGRPFKDNLITSKLRRMKDRETFLNLMKQYAKSPDARRLSDSSKSPAYCTRQSISALNSDQSNRSFGTFDSTQSDVSLNSKQSNDSSLSTRHSYLTRFRNTSQSSRSSLIPTRRSSALVSPEKRETSAIDKTVIDLTSEDDDETQRREIKSNVLSSEHIRNLKTTFVGKNKSIAEEDYISNILKKYEASIQSKEHEAEKFRQQIRKRRDDFNKTLAEILESRLIIKEHEAEEEPKPAFELAPITAAMTTAINQIVASKKVPLVQIKDTSVKIQDIRTLENCAWLNDEVINAYMNLIKMRAEKKPDKYPKVHCFNTFLYEQLQKKGYTAVRRWTKKIDIFDFNMLIIPIHLGNHWCLIQIKIKEKCIRYFDSMGSPNNHCLKSMRQYLVDEYKDKKNGDLDAEEWELINMPPSDIPQQRNMHDCGVFACTFAEHLTRQAPFNFTQENMPYFRLKMMYEILTAELLL